MKTWYQLYNPIIISERYPVSYWQDLSPEDFKKLFIDSDIQIKIPLHLMAAEYHWIKADRLTYFIQEDATIPALLDEPNLQQPICLSFHKSYNIQPCLIYPTTPGIMIHIVGKGVGLMGAPYMKRVLKAVQLQAHLGLPFDMKERNKKHFKGKGFHL